jgi:hypothetical protein
MENFNELFKKKLAEQQFDGKEKYWTQLEKKLNENAQEKVVIAWYKKWLLPVIAIVTIGIAALLYSNSINTNTQNKSTGPNTEKNDQLLAAQEVVESPKNNTPNNSNTLNNEVSIDDDAKLPDNIENTNNPNDDKIETSKASSSLISRSESTKNITPVAYNVTNNTTNNTTLNNKKTTIASASMLIKEPLLSNADMDETNNQSAELNLNPLVPANISKTETNQTAQNPSQKNILASSSTKSKTLDFSQVEMPLAYLSPKALSALFYPAKTMNLADKVVPINAKRPKTTVNLSVYGGAMYSIKNIMTQDGNTSAYLNRRKTEESNSVKPNVGIDVELKHGHWTLTSGFNFHQQGEKRNYSDQFKRLVPYDSIVININNNSSWLVDSSMFYALQYNSIVTSIDTTITYYDETTGQFYTAQLPLNITQNTLIDTNFYYHIDSTYLEAIDTTKTNYALKKQIIVKDPNQTYLKGRNTFTYVEVPVLIGYEWGLKRWRLSVKGGLGLGILTRQQSFYLTTDEAEIAPVSTDVYTKVVYNGIFRVGMHYSFTPQFGIDIVPFSRLNINNMTHKNAPFKQKYYNVGLQVGLYYKL